MIWSVILRSKAGSKIVTTHIPLFLDAVETKTKILGSLASRWAKPPVKPTSQFARLPVFSRKRGQRGGTEQPRRKSLRLAGSDPTVIIPSIELGDVMEDGEGTSENE